MNPNGSILLSSEHFLESPNCWNTQLSGIWEYVDLTNTLFHPNPSPALQPHLGPRGLLSSFPILVDRVFTELFSHTVLKGRAQGLLS